ncbi:MAG: hypothetical protein JXB47_19680 [Anaerolineae bacterium]|nr:hypothetical protein [Anaerolineae bacterium]
MKRITIEHFVLILSLLMILPMSGCIVQRDVIVVVTATPEPVTNTPQEPTPTFTAPPPPTSTSVPTEPGPTSLPSAFPTPITAQIYVAEQVFEHGRIFWVEPTDEMWVVVDDGSGSGRWLKYADTFAEGEPEDDPLLTPPSNLRQPIRGFGKVWRENPEVQELLGWAKDIEYGYTTAYRYDYGGYVDDGGKYVPGPGIHTLTTLGNETVHFYERTSTWSFE